MQQKRRAIYALSDHSSLAAAVRSKIVGEGLTNIESLPDELVFAILVHVPPQDIHNGARLVCRRWYRIIHSPDFSHANLEHSPPGLLIQYLCEGRMNWFFAAMRQGRIKISELNYKFKSISVGSCNGLVVENNPTGGNICVVNPTTEQRYALPPITLKATTKKQKPSSLACAVMAYASASMEYKVVLMYLYRCDVMTGVPYCAISTVGVDRDWRHIDSEHLKPLTATEFLRCSPVIAGSFIHWTQCQSTHLLTLNAETEVFTSTPVPQGYEERLKYYLSTGSSLTMLVVCSDLSWEVWELKQKESGEWCKLFKIDVEAQQGRIQELEPKHSHILRPVGWLNFGEVLVLRAIHYYGEVLMLRAPKVCFLYNVRTQEIDSFKLNHNKSSSYHRFQFHRNSLVHLVV